jgi:hypothetical protein
MSGGRKPLPGPDIEYCTRYHCPGDCGQPHNQEEMVDHVVSLKAAKASRERKRYAESVLDAYDRLFPERAKKAPSGKSETLDTNPEVRRKAKQAL